MQEAKLRKQAERAETQRRRAEEQAEMEQKRAAEEVEIGQQQQAAREEYEEQLAQVQARYTQHGDLTSTVSSTYAEMDKLNRKNPKMLVTDLSLKMVNEAIVDVKNFVTDDPYLDRITIFEPAGDYIQVCDVVLVLSQVSSALQRFKKKLPPYPTPPPLTPQERLQNILSRDY